MGPWICVLGAVFTDKPIVQPLTPLLWLGTLHARKTQYEEITRLFASLSTGIQELEEFYSGVDFQLVSEARLFPYITTFIDSSAGHEVQFTYERTADSIPAAGQAFIAKTQDGRKIVVKFTEAYNATAHSLLAAEGFAPPLVASEQSACSDFTMVVTSYIEGMRILPHVYSYAPSQNALAPTVRALRILHANDLVFGYLRPQNIHVDGSGYAAHLVGFDWCGKAGEGEYPPDINLLGIEWPAGVVPGGLLQFEHDNEMLRRLGAGGYL